MTICDQQTGGNILCIRLSAMGDVVHCMNALTLLRRSRPAARITWIVEERFSGLLDGHPDIDELIPLPRMDWARALKDPWRWAEVWPEITGLMSSLRRSRFDSSIDFQSSMKSSWLVAAAGAPLRIGFATPVSREGNRLFQNRLVTVPQRGCHRIERNLALLAPLGIPTGYAPASLPCAAQHRQVAEGICDGLRRPLVVLHPGASYFARFKRWEPENYGALALKLIRDCGASVLVSFGPGEEALAHRVVVAARHRAQLIPRLSHLQQLTGLLGLADLFVGGDTGPLHIASALNTPVVALFGPKDPAGTGPYTGSFEVVRADVPCSPCSLRECRDPVCMRRIRVEQVYEAAVRRLHGACGRPGRRSADTGARPFFSGFELGRWSGTIHTLFSRPENYRFLAAPGLEQGAGAPDADGTGRDEVLLEGPQGRMLLRRRDGRSGPIGFPLKRHWIMAARLYEQRIRAPVPIAWMQRGRWPMRREMLFLDGRHAAAVAINDENKRRVLPPAAALFRQLHRNGFHVCRLGADDLAVLSGGDVTLRRLEKLRRLPLPPLVREVVWGWQLKGLYRALRGIVSASEFTEYFLKPYAEHHLKTARSRQLLAAVLHRQRPDLESTGSACRRFRAEAACDE